MAHIGKMLQGERDFPRICRALLSECIKLIDKRKPFLISASANGYIVLLDKSDQEKVISMPMSIDPDNNLLSGCSSIYLEAMAYYKIINKIGGNYYTYNKKAVQVVEFLEL